MYYSVFSSFFIQLLYLNKIPAIDDRYLAVIILVVNSTYSPKMYNYKIDTFKGNFWKENTRAVVYITKYFLK